METNELNNLNLEEFKCELCGNTFNVLNGEFGRHLRFCHKWTTLAYYYEFLKEGHKCVVCGKPLDWRHSFKTTISRYVCNAGCYLVLMNKNCLENKTDLRIRSNYTKLVTKYKDELETESIIYFGDSEFPGYFKFGVSKFELWYRQTLYDHHKEVGHKTVTNLVEIRRMPLVTAAKCERDIKYKYLDKMDPAKTNSFELLPIELKDEVRDFILNYTNEDLNP